MRERRGVKASIFDVGGEGEEGLGAEAATLAQYEEFFEEGYEEEALPRYAPTFDDLAQRIERVIEEAAMEEPWIKRLSKVIDAGPPCILLVGDASEWMPIIEKVFAEKGYALSLPGGLLGERYRPGAIAGKRRVSFIDEAETKLLDPRFRTKTGEYHTVAAKINSPAPGVKVVLQVFNPSSLPTELLMKCVSVCVDPPSSRLIETVASEFGIDPKELRYLKGLPLVHLKSAIRSRVSGKEIDLAEYRKSVFTSIRDLVDIATEYRMTWRDLGDMARVKQVIEESVISVFEDPDEAERLGLRPPRILMMGPPGTGKSVLAQAIASRLRNSVLISFNISKILSMWLGESEKRFSQVLNLVKSMASAGPRSPVVFFIDEIDTAFPSRWKQEGPAASGQSSVMTSILGMFLRFLEEDALRLQGLVVIAATNRPSNIDEAMLSRFNLRIPVLPPKTPEERSEIITKIIEKECGGIEIEWPSVQQAIQEISLRAEGYTPRDFRSMIDVARYKAVAKKKVRGRVVLTGQDVLEAFREIKPVMSPSEIQTEEAVARKYSSVKI